VVSGWRSEKIGMGLGWFPEKKQIQKASSAVCTEEQRSCLQKKKNGVDMYKEELVLGLSCTLPVSSPSSAPSPSGTVRYSVLTIHLLFLLT
jgi:hypothetical protein